MCIPSDFVHKKGEWFFPGVHFDNSDGYNDFIHNSPSFISFLSDFESILGEHSSNNDYTCRK